MISSIETLTLVLAIISVIIFLILAVLAIVYFKMKNNTGTENSKPVNTEEADGEKLPKSKTYAIASVNDFMEFDKIENNMIIQNNGAKFIGVVGCQGINYDLMSQAEKNSVEAGFGQFLNTISHPIQIYVQTRKVNLNNSIQTYKDKIVEMEEKLERQRNRYNQMAKSGKYSQEELDREFFELSKQENLYEYGRDIIINTERMSLNRNVLNQKYYIIIPYLTAELGQNNYSKEEIKEIAFSELYTRAQSIIRTLSACEISAKMLNSNELVDLLYVAYNRDEEEIYSFENAMRSGYDELYSTAPDVLDKKIRQLDEEIEVRAIEEATNAVQEARSEKQKALARKEESIDDLVREMAKLIIDENESVIGKDVSERAKKKVDSKKTKDKEVAKKDGEKEKTTRKPRKSRAV